jgi:hypothetical protein
VMHVGISESDPWVRTGGREPGGVEVQHRMGTAITGPSRSRSSPPRWRCC